MKMMVDTFIQHSRQVTDDIHEIIFLAPSLNKEQYRRLLNSLLDIFQRNTLLNVDILQGLVQLVQEAPELFLRPDDLTQILRTIRERLKTSSQHNDTVHLMAAMSAVIMTDLKLQGLDQRQEHEPLLEILSILRKDKDPFIKYQAEYAFQALLTVPDDESTLDRFARHSLGLAGGLLKLSGVIKLDFTVVSEAVPAVIQGGKGLFESLKKATKSEPRCPWYIAVRDAEKTIKSGSVSELSTLIQVNFRDETMFLWGICQLFGEIAVDASWDEDTRDAAVRFLVNYTRPTQPRNKSGMISGAGY